MTADRLKELLQAAVELELSTIPPYLCAMVLAANVLNALGGQPRVGGPDHAPRYPRVLPDGVVLDLSARKALEEVVEQGEGDMHWMYDADGDLAHYFRLQQLKYDRSYRRCQHTPRPRGAARRPHLRVGSVRSMTTAVAVPVDSAQRGCQHPRSLQSLASEASEGRRTVGHIQDWGLA